MMIMSQHLNRDTNVTGKIDTIPVNTTGRKHWRVGDSRMSTCGCSDVRLAHKHMCRVPSHYSLSVTGSVWSHTFICFCTLIPVWLSSGLRMRTEARTLCLCNDAQVNLMPGQEHALLHFLI